MRATERRISPAKGKGNSKIRRKFADGFGVRLGPKSLALPR
jgi:hypothetical protein